MSVPKLVAASGPGLVIVAAAALLLLPMLKLGIIVTHSCPSVSSGRRSSATKSAPEYSPRGGCPIRSTGSGLQPSISTRRCSSGSTHSSASSRLPRGCWSWRRRRDPRRRSSRHLPAAAPLLAGMDLFRRLLVLVLRGLKLMVSQARSKRPKKRRCRNTRPPNICHGDIAIRAR